MIASLSSPRSTTGWMPGLTKSFRNGSRKLWDTYGGNLQNIPDELRRIFIPDEGRIFLQADQSGAEALIVAYECTDGTYRQLFTNGIKIHSWLAMQLFADSYWKHNTPFDVKHLCSLSPRDLVANPSWEALAKTIKDSDGWEPKKRFYFIAKMVCHASNYGMHAPTFQMNVLQKSSGAIALTRREAEQFLEMFHNLFPEIRIWHHRIREKLEKDRTLRNLFGFPRLFAAGTFDQKLWKEAYSWIPQSTVGCITNIAWCKLQSLIEEMGYAWDLLINCHDSILMQIPPPDVAMASRALSDALSMPLVSTDGVTHYRMKAEVSVGHNWGKKKDKDNPDGMDEYALST